MILQLEELRGKAQLDYNRFAVDTSAQLREVCRLMYMYLLVVLILMRYCFALGIIVVSGLVYLISLSWYKRLHSGRELLWALLNLLPA